MFSISKVSIHAPRVGCDEKTIRHIIIPLSFNSRTPCGVRLIVLVLYSMMFTFQFTHPVWGATDSVSFMPNSEVVSIHAPRVGCDREDAVDDAHDRRFNSRTPCGVRLDSRYVDQLRPEFQFTHPVWGATRRSSGRARWTSVSIHAPRVGCDTMSRS